MPAPAAPLLAPEQDTLVRMTCDQVMGLARGGVYRAECRESLARTLVRQAETRDMTAAYSDCRRQNLLEGSPAFSTCMLERRSRPVAAVARSASLSYDATAPENAKGYFEVSNAVHWRRFRYACAQLGLTPGSGAFDQCVVDLNAALAPDPF